MITNLIASIVVTLVTNTTEKVTAWERMVQAPCPDLKYGYNCLVLHWKGENPTAKETTTTIELVKVATFDWEGVKHSVTNRTVIGGDTVATRLIWERYTNAPPQWESLNPNWRTNYIGIEAGPGVSTATNGPGYVLSWNGTNMVWTDDVVGTNGIEATTLTNEWNGDVRDWELGSDMIWRKKQ